MADFEISDNPVFNSKLRKMEKTDPAHADLFNEVVGQLLVNEVFVKLFAESLQEVLTKHVDDIGIHFTETEREKLKEIAYDSNTCRTANTILAAPDGSKGAATFRKLVAADIPAIQSFELSKTADLDDLLDQNFTAYYCSDSNTVTNNPENGKAFGLFVYRSATGYITQELISKTGNKHIRFYNSTEWSSWKTVVYTSGSVKLANIAMCDGAENEITTTYAKKDNTLLTGALSHNGNATGNYSACLGYSGNKSTAPMSIAMGGNTTASMHYGTAMGYGTTAGGICGTAMGYYTTALECQCTHGAYNNTSTATAYTTDGGTSSGSILVLGNGTSSSKSNAFRVQGDGKVYATGAYNATGADYAEYAEWADGNPNAEDRRGYFVTFDEESPTKIRKANTGEYILGIVSGNPCIIGNGDEDWRGRYILDEFGAFITEEVEEEVEELDLETEKLVKRTAIVTKYKENPDYDKTQEYVTRAERPEWAAVGWLGVLSVRDDGTCMVGSYCTVADGGIATAAERGNDSYRVIERISDNVITVVLK